MKVHIKYIYYYKFETKLLLITNKKLGKIGRVKVHSHDGQWKGIVMFTPTLRCECAPTRPDRYNAKMVYTTLFLPLVPFPKDGHNWTLCLKSIVQSFQRAFSTVQIFVHIPYSIYDYIR